MNEFNLPVTFVPVICSQCGILFAISSGFFKARNEDEGDFYCPSGHGQHYPSEERRKQRMAEQKLAEETRLARKEAARLRAIEKKDEVLRRLGDANSPSLAVSKENHPPTWGITQEGHKP